MSVTQIKDSRAPHTHLVPHPVLHGISALPPRFLSREEKRCGYAKLCPTLSCYGPPVCQSPSPPLWGISASVSPFSRTPAGGGVCVPTEQYGLIFQDMGFTVFEYSIWNTSDLCSDPSMFVEVLQVEPPLPPHSESPPTPDLWSHCLPISSLPPPLQTPAGFGFFFPPKLFTENTPKSLFLTLNAGCLLCMVEVVPG